MFIMQIYANLLYIRCQEYYINSPHHIFGIYGCYLQVIMIICVYLGGLLLISSGLSWVLAYNMYFVSVVGYVGRYDKEPYDVYSLSCESWNSEFYQDLLSFRYMFDDTLLV